MTFEANGSKVIPASKLERNNVGLIEVGEEDIEASLLGVVLFIDQEQLDAMSQEERDNILGQFDVVITFVRSEGDNDKILTPGGINFLGSLAYALQDTPKNSHPLGSLVGNPHDVAMHQIVREVRDGILASNRHQQNGHSQAGRPIEQSLSKPQTSSNNNGNDQMVVAWKDFPLSERTKRLRDNTEMDLQAA